MQTVTVNGGNCYQLASQYLGDASQFIRIMIQNNLTDPFIAGPEPTTLVIPDVDPTATGGVLPQ